MREQVTNCLSFTSDWLRRWREILNGRDTLCEKSLRHVAATGCCNKSRRVTCENLCRCDLSQKSNSFEFVRQIAAIQNRRKRLVAAAVQTERLVAALCRRVCLGQSLSVVVVQNLKKKRTRELLSTLKLKSLIFSWPRFAP